MNKQPDALLQRQAQADHPVAPLFLRRWSPRALSAQVLPEADLYCMLEAARWAPSAYNIQPWRFIYSLRGDTAWQSLLDVLDPFNAAWASNAAALVFVLSDTLKQPPGEAEPRPSGTHQFDAGAAWAHLALQATDMGYQAHAMAGIHFTDARRVLQIPERLQLHVAIAIGKQAPISTLPEELQQREAPSGRMPLDAFCFHGRFLGRFRDRREDARSGEAA